MSPQNPFQLPPHFACGETEAEEKNDQFLPHNINAPVSETRDAGAAAWRRVDAPLLSLFSCCSFLLCSPGSLPLSCPSPANYPFFHTASSLGPFSLSAPHLLPHSGSSCLGTLGEPPRPWHTPEPQLRLGGGQPAAGSRRWAVGWGQWAEGRRSWQSQRSGKWGVGSQPL